MRVFSNKDAAFMPNKSGCAELVNVTVIRKISQSEYKIKIVKNGRESVVSAKSVTVLHEGEKLVAVIKAKGNQILLERREPLRNNEIMHSSMLDDFFSSLDLPYNEMTLTAARMFWDMRMKIDSKIIRNALSLAFAFEGREKEAVEIAVSLMNTKKNVDKTDIQNVFFLSELTEKDNVENPFEENVSSGGKEFAWIFQKINFDCILDKNQQKKGKGLLKVLVKKNEKNIKRFVVSFKTENRFYECVFRNLYGKFKIHAYTSETSKTEEFASILKKFFPESSVNSFFSKKSFFYPDEFEYQVVNEMV